MNPPAPESERRAGLRLVLLPAIPAVRVVAEKVREFLAERGVSQEDGFACELCVVEAGNNAVEYVTRKGRDRHTFVDVECSVDQLEIRVSDHSAGWDWPERAMDPLLTKERGRGVFLIQSYMDEVHYLRGTRENVLVMRRIRRKTGTVDADAATERLIGGREVESGGNDAVGSEASDLVPAVSAGTPAWLRPGSEPRDKDLRAQVIDRELEMARMIQRSLLPVTLPEVPGFGLAGGWHCAREISGDFYDAIALDEHVYLLMVADVMGTGIPAALFATNLRGLLRGLSVRFDDPAQLLSRLNRLLHDELSSVGMFITAQVAVIDVRTRVVTAAGAGHGPMLHLSADGETVVPFATEGMPLGVLPEVEYRSRTFHLGRPGLLLLHTDGLTDVRNDGGERFGQERLAAWLGENRTRGRSATEIRGRLASELNRYRGNAAMSDDQAFLLLSEASAEPSAKRPLSRRARLSGHPVPAASGS